MAAHVTQKADFSVVEFDGDLTIFSVREIYDQMMEMVATKPAKVIFDLAGVQDFDSAGLQLLIWLSTQCQIGQVTVTYEGNEAVERIVNLYQLPKNYLSGKARARS